MEIWRVCKSGKLACLLKVPLHEVDEALVKMDVKYPGSIFIITPQLVARRIDNQGGVYNKTTSKDCYE
jgi:hypothetical protein